MYPCQFVHEYKGIYWNMGPQLWRQLVSPPHQLPASPQEGVGPHPVPSFDLVQALCSQLQPLWADYENSSVLSGKQCFPGATHYPRLLQAFLISAMIPETSEKGY